MDRIFTDQMGRTLTLSYPPRRIVSLVPSQTELLYALGLEDEVVGITKFCVHPEVWYRQKARVGGTKQFRFDLIEQLQPNLIIGNKEENERTQIEALAERFPVWMSNIQTLEDALRMIEQVGELTGKIIEARQLAYRIDAELLHWQTERPDASLRAAYFIWRAPYMVAAADTFIHEMLRLAGFSNVFGHLQRYPEISLSMLSDTQPDVILLSSEPFPFKEKHIAEFKQVCPTAVIKIVDGEVFSWYGSRLLHAAGYFRALWAALIKEMKIKDW